MIQTVQRDIAHHKVSCSYKLGDLNGQGWLLLGDRLDIIQGVESTAVVHHLLFLDFLSLLCISIITVLLLLVLLLYFPFFPITKLFLSQPTSVYYFLILLPYSLGERGVREHLHGTELLLGLKHNAQIFRVPPQSNPVCRTGPQQWECLSVHSEKIRDLPESPKWEPREARLRLPSTLRSQL